LDRTENLKAAKVALSGLVGVYAITLKGLTGAVFIGFQSSSNIGNRLVSHLVSNNTNKRLLRALNKYGLENFTFAVVEIFKVDPKVSNGENKARLLAMEQVYLKWGFLSLLPF
jgi:hypothetical protein